MPNVHSSRKEDMKVAEEPEQLISLLSDHLMSSSENDTNKSAHLELEPTFDLQKFKVESARCVLEIKIFINVIKETITRFYYMENR